MPFEIQGAIAARKFLEGEGLAAERAGIVWDGIAMHPLAISEHKRPEISLVAAGAGADVVGSDLDKVNRTEMAEIVNAYPRLDFKVAFIRSCADIVRKYPGGASRTFMRDIGEQEVPGFHPRNICDSIQAAPFQG